MRSWALGEMAPRFSFFYLGWVHKEGNTLTIDRPILTLCLDLADAKACDLLVAARMPNFLRQLAYAEGSNRVAGLFHYVGVCSGSSKVPDGDIVPASEPLVSLPISRRGCTFSSITLDRPALKRTSSIDVPTPL